MRVVVTGGTGFVGGHLVERLCASPAVREPVVVLENFHRSTADRLAALVATGAVRLLEGDIRDARAVNEACAGADVVFHLAAQSNVLGAETDPDYSQSTNVTGTFRVLQAARVAGVRRVVIASSREVYGQPQRLPVPESAPIEPRNVYGATKAAAEMLARAIASQSALEVIALRLANVYGPGDAGRVIPLWLERAARGEDLLLYGGGQVLDLVSIEDTVAAFIAAAEAPRAAFAPARMAQQGSGGFAALNVGSGVGTSLVALTERIQRLLGSTSRVVRLPARSAEVERFVADTSLLSRVLDLRPDTTLAMLTRMAEALRPGAAAVADAIERARSSEEANE